MRINSGKLVGNKHEITCFKVAMFLWKHRTIFFIVLTVLCFIPVFFSPILFSPYIHSFFPITAFFLLAMGNKTGNTVLSTILKKLILVEGMIVSVPYGEEIEQIEINSEFTTTPHQKFTFGAYLRHDKGTNLHIVLRDGIKYAYEFKDIAPALEELDNKWE